ncbi:MAG TPA: sugar transferase [Candidatus Udaeobacter sp.]|jgi:lipopolysaccharide/colanic/teichoic acid biosynthesis glycosyltransferase|nr:sugar transferase [Candidatus Udaeobacter sp.]
MEPDILATPSDPRTREAVPPSGALARVQTPVESLAADGAILAPAAEPAPLNGHGPSNGTTHIHALNGHAHTNGVTNGHGLNGHAHANGVSNGHARNGSGLSGHAHFPLLESERWVPVAAGRGTVALPPSLAHAGTIRDHGLYLRGGKRVLDIIGSFCALVLSAPVLLLAALAIRLESGGPVFYKSTRIGRGGRPFTFYKLRSMVDGADRHRHHLTHLNEADGPVFKICNDPRVTRVGRFLRSSSIDEIPQFFHVLSGDMSLVGPRPPLPEEVAQYEPWQMRRLNVRPGLTCLWQVNGRSRIGFQEWMRLDLEYIRRQSAMLDLKILLRTIPAVISREGAY